MKSQATLIPLRRGPYGDLFVSPRGLARRVWISSTAILKLQQAQKLLPTEMCFVLLRAYEPGTWGRKRFRSLLRRLGGSVFALLFPTRAGQTNDIFCANGHDLDGNHLDVAVMYRGRQLRFLPFGVFTPANLVARRAGDPLVESAWRALCAVGFTIHRNPTEALQIHCDVC